MYYGFLKINYFKLELQIKMFHTKLSSKGMINNET